MEEKPGEIRVGLKRFRDKTGRYKYRALPIFPVGATVNDDILSSKPPSGINPKVYFEPENACVQHACDDLYKANKDTNGTFYLPAKDVHQAIADLQKNGQNIYEYQLEKTSEGSTNKILKIIC